MNNPLKNIILTLFLFCCLLLPSCISKTPNENAMSTNQSDIENTTDNNITTENITTTTITTEPELIEGDFKYIILSDGTVEIKKYQGDSETISIPSLLNGYTVTKIGESAFANSIGEESSLTNVTIPDSITEIADSAFYNSSNLSYIEIPNSVILIGCDAFTYTPFLENQTEDFIIINHHLIKYKGIEENVIIPDGIKYINNAFMSNENIKSVIIPDSVIKIGDLAFYACENLISVVMPDNNVAIGRQAFAGCFNLSEINLPLSINEIDYRAFSFTKFVFEKATQDGYVVINNILIDSDVFSVKGDVKIPDYFKITKIAGGAFSVRDELTGVIIPDGVEKIEEMAFERCYYLKNVTIPDSVTEIEKDAFFDCINLKILCTQDSYAHQYSVENGIEFELI